MTSSVRDRPLPTDCYDSWNQFRPLPDSAYIFAASVEQRSEHPQEWQDSCTGVSFFQVTSESLDSFSIVVGGSEREVLLRSRSQLDALIQDVPDSLFYLERVMNHR